MWKLADIPNRSNRRQRFIFSPWLYRQRSLVARCFNGSSPYQCTIGSPATGQRK